MNRITKLKSEFSAPQSYTTSTSTKAAAPVPVQPTAGLPNLDQLNFIGRAVGSMNNQQKKLGVDESTKTELNSVEQTTQVRFY